jgi:phage-related protein
MYINDIPLSDYGGKLLKRVISSPDIGLSTFWAKKALRPHISKDIGYYYKELKMEIELKGSPQEIQINKSRLIKALTSASVAFGKLEHNYTGVIDYAGTGDQVNGFEVLKVDMLVYEHEDEQILELNQTDISTIYLESNHETPVILEILPTNHVASVTITGFGRDIILKNLTAGVPVIIDGEKGIVTENEMNKWNDYDSWGFPELAPGENDIALSEDTLDITVRFSPRWA